MKTQFVSIGLILLSTLFIMSCKSEATTSSEDSRKAQDEALKNMEKGFESLKSGSGEVVDFRVLKDALPDKIAGMDRISHNGNKTGFGDMKVSTAEATYVDGDKKVQITIVDTGGFGAVLGSMAAWSQLEIDNESDDGYERTVMIDGKKAIEKYNSKTNEGSISVISADRFIVNIDGRGVSESDMRAAVSKIKIKA